MTATLLVVGIVLGMAGVGALMYGLWPGAKKDGSFKLGAGVCLAAAAVLIVLSQCFSVVNTGNVAVVTKWGQVKEVRSSGVIWKAPFVEAVEVLNIQQKNVTLAQDAWIWAECNDQTPLKFNKIFVSYQVTDRDAALWLRTNTDFNGTVTLDNYIQSALEQTTKSLSPSDAINRALIEPGVREALQATLDQKYGGRRINILVVTINSIEYDDKYADAITAKNVAAQNAQQKQIENEQAIANAEADAKKNKIAEESAAELKRIKAEAEAAAILIEAKAQAEANELLTKSLSEQILANNWIVKWDGKMPIVTDGSGNIIDISALLGGS